jgi:hypothetical protein
MALMGNNLVMLYTEDTYELEGEPFFGYMRGRFSFDEVRELDDYAFNLGMEYKGFGINATFQGAAHQVKNLRYVDGVWGALSDNRNLSVEYFTNCYDVRGASAKYPRLSTENVANNVQNSTIWYRNISWLKLRDCEIYYKLPASLINPLNVTGAKLFVQGQNLLSFDNIDAMDAENLNTGYPVLKAVNFGLSVQF